jgi:hypothetical protein
MCSIMFPAMDHVEDKIPPTVCWILLWDKWDELQDWPSSFTTFLNVNQPIPTIANLFVIQSSYCINYIRGGHFPGLFVHCVTVTKYCVNWTTKDSSLYTFCDPKAQQCSMPLVKNFFHVTHTVCTVALPSWAPTTGPGLFPCCNYSDCIILLYCATIKVWPACIIVCWCVFWCKLY